MTKDVELSSVTTLKPNRGLIGITISSFRYIHIKLHELVHTKPPSLIGRNSDTMSKQVSAPVQAIEVLLFKPALPLGFTSNVK